LTGAPPSAGLVVWPAEAGPATRKTGSSASEARIWTARPRGSWKCRRIVWSSFGPKRPQFGFEGCWAATGGRAR